MTGRRGALLGREEFARALTAVGAKLGAKGIVGDVYLVGGAAMVLAYQARVMTREIDAVFAPSDAIYRAAKEVQEDLGLPIGWLNDAAKAYVPGLDRKAIPVMTVPGLRVSAASPEFMLGMKLLAARSEQEREDIAYLANLLNLATSTEILELVERPYPPNLIPARTEFLVREMFPAQLEMPRAPQALESDSTVHPPRRSVDRGDASIT